GCGSGPPSRRAKKDSRAVGQICADKSEPTPPANTSSPSRPSAGTPEVIDVPPEAPAPRPEASNSAPTGAESGRQVPEFLDDDGDAVPTLPEEESRSTRPQDDLDVPDFLK